MNFNEALELLKQGKKVRRKDWESLDTYIAFSGDDNVLILIDDTGEFSKSYYHLYKYDILANDWEEYKEPLLTEEEKEYLKMVINYYPFEISKVSLDYDDEYANEKFIKLHNNFGFDEAIYVKSGSFMNLELEKEYTLKELGLDE